MPTLVRPQVHTSTCGHVMHSTCWQAFFDIVLAKETRRPYRLRQPTSYDVEKQEFLCPLCECLGNTVIPLLPDVPRPSFPPSTLSFQGFLAGLEAAVKLRAAKSDVEASNRYPTLEQVRIPIDYDLKVHARLNSTLSL